VLILVCHPLSSIVGFILGGSLVNALKPYPQIASNRWRSGEVLCVQEISLSCESSLLLIGDLLKISWQVITGVE